MYSLSDMTKFLFQLQFMKTLFGAMVILFMPLYYIKYYQEDLAVAAAHLGTMGIFSTVISYAAPLASLVSELRHVCAMNCRHKLYVGHVCKMIHKIN